MGFGNFGVDASASQDPSTAQQITNDLLNVGVSFVQAKAAQDVASKQSAAAKTASAAATAQANALVKQAQAQQAIASTNAAASSKKWLYIIGGSVVGIAILGFLYFKYMRRRD
jgi:hypothetical protein